MLLDKCSFSLSVESSLWVWTESKFRAQPVLVATLLKCFYCPFNLKVTALGSKFVMYNVLENEFHGLERFVETNRKRMMKNLICNYYSILSYSSILTSIFIGLNLI
jgi:hypothetical protein